MSWTPPLTWTDGLLVAASTLNAQLRDNLRYLKGQLGEIFFENALDIAETAQPSNPPAGRVRVWNTNVANQQMLYGRFSDGTQRRLAHYAIRLRRSTILPVPASTVTTVPFDIIDFSSHPSLSMSNGMGFVAPEAGLYLATATVFMQGSATDGWVSIQVNNVSQVVSGVMSSTVGHTVTTVISLNQNDNVRVVVYYTLAGTVFPLQNTPSLSVVSL